MPFYPAPNIPIHLVSATDEILHSTTTDVNGDYIIPIWLVLDTNRFFYVRAARDTNTDGSIVDGVDQIGGSYGGASPTLIDAVQYPVAISGIDFTVDESFI